ncbi:MAG: SRPBCC family protein [Cellvibrionaceae bacterium]|nr:SRPBCC family protein [Cellvibrionaceae bacterium]
MSQSSVAHSTFSIEREYPQAAAKVFQAFSDPVKKRRWFAEGEGFIVDSFTIDFRVGGKETCLFRIQEGPVAGQICRNDTWYMDIVADRRLVTAYNMTLGDNRISSSLSTVELFSLQDKTLLKFTEQAAFYDGADGAEMRREGWRFLLEKLAKELGG